MKDHSTPGGPRSSTARAGARAAEEMLLDEDLVRQFREWLKGQRDEVRELLERIYMKGLPLPVLPPAEELARVRALNRFRRETLARPRARGRSPKDLPR